ncbi:MAG: DUF3048 domain-containing protein [Acidimicrobiia bacterium]
MRTKLAWLVALGLILAACSGSVEEAGSTTTSEPTTTTSESTTTTTTAPTTTLAGPTSPINGLPVDDPALLDRRLLAVKMDNHPNARPQSGVQEADVVFEIVVEGITRFLTLWQQSDTEYFGPMRSGRPTEVAFLTAPNNPTFAFSGAQSWVQALIRSKDINLIGEVRPATFRISGRFAPHNLYVNTNLLRDYADEKGYPDEPPTGPIWEFGDLPASAEPASSVEIDFVGNTVNWDWDQGTGTWLRTADGRESMWRTEDGEEGRIGFPVVIALYTEQYLHSPSGRGKSLPSSMTIGSGEAYVFANGKVVKGTWEREDEKDWFTLTDEAGKVIPVPAGKAWISLVPTNNGLTYE